MRHPEYKDFSVADMLEQEHAHMMPMPTPFDGYVEKLSWVSTACLINTHRNLYSVPCELAGFDFESSTVDLVIVETGNIIRIISARRTTKIERNYYHGVRP